MAHVSSLAGWLQHVTNFFFCGHRALQLNTAHLGCVAGSSGGSASSIAARFAPWALCEDTGGSCRAPAMANGIYGLRPTLGCYNYSDSLVLSTFTRDTVGEALCVLLSSACCRVQRITAQSGLLWDSAAQHSTAQCDTAQCDTAQHRTAPHSTAQPSTAQHSRTLPCPALPHW